MLSCAEIDEKIQIGYTKECDGKDCLGACDVWLEAWEGVKAVMEADGLLEIVEMDNKYTFGQFIYNYVQDLELELLNAGTEDKSYCQKHINYCKELIDRCGADRLMLENTRRNMAMSYFRTGDHEKSGHMFEEWLQKDADWGWGYIGWADCYAWELKEPQYARAAEILSLGLSRAGLRDRIDVVDRAIEISEELGDTEKARSYRREKQWLSSVHVEKVGPNDPCPCGSGKKYKKCCSE